MYVVLPNELKVRLVVPGVVNLEPAVMPPSNVVLLAVVIFRRCHYILLFT